MITIIDYGLGNVRAFANIYKKLNIQTIIAKAPREIIAAEKLILPGVGAFDWAMSRLNDSGMRESLEELVLSKGVPVLGICVGMQIMAKRSEEGELDGMNWIDSEVKRFDQLGNMKLPHMGWNDISPCTDEPLFNNLGADARFYFLHSYYFFPHDERQVISHTDYHGSFASAVRYRNFYGVQFHPEKSHHWGIQLLKNFAEM
jgi:imidazole glycerol-phosphate synthase subunit HisH